MYIHINNRIEYRFTCNSEKNEKNIRKHAIDLLKAGELLYAPHAVLEDDRKDYGEERYIAKGYLNGIPIAVVYTMRGFDHIHVI